MSAKKTELSRTVNLSDLSDGDLAQRDKLVRRLRKNVSVPHPLHNVQYADGVMEDTTAGRIHSRNWWSRRDR